jgi:hypothetical protein
MVRNLDQEGYEHEQLGAEEDGPQRKQREERSGSPDDDPQADRRSGAGSLDRLVVLARGYPPRISEALHSLRSAKAFALLVNHDAKAAR